MNKDDKETKMKKKIDIIDQLISYRLNSQIEFMKAMDLYHEKYILPLIAARKLQLSKKLKEIKKAKKKKNEPKT